MLAALAVGLFCFRYVVKTAGPHTDAQTSPSKDLTQPTWPTAALLGVLGSGLLFTAVYEQSGQSLLLWARDCTRHSLLGYSVPPSSLLGIPGLLVLGIQPLLNRTQSALSRRGHRPSPLLRIGIGLLFGVVAYLIMVIAALRQERSQALVTPAWLVACFAVLTVAELLVYPLGMSLVTRLAPQSATAAAMGLWLVSLAGGHWLAGEVASRWAMWSHATLFSVLAALALAAVIVLALAARPIRRAMQVDVHVDKG
jgi:POT family proton-dependent oligopeptide transporter